MRLGCRMNMWIRGFVRLILVSSLYVYFFVIVNHFVSDGDSIVSVAYLGAAMFYFITKVINLVDELIDDSVKGEC